MISEESNNQISVEQMKTTLTQGLNDVDDDLLMNDEDVL